MTFVGIELLSESFAFLYKKDHIFNNIKGKHQTNGKSFRKTDIDIGSEFSELLTHLDLVDHYRYFLNFTHRKFRTEIS